MQRDDYQEATFQARREAYEKAKPKLTSQKKRILYFTIRYFHEFGTGPTYVELWEYMEQFGIRMLRHIVSSRLSELRKEGRIKSLDRNGKTASVNYVTPAGREYLDVKV